MKRLFVLAVAGTALGIGATLCTGEGRAAEPIALHANTAGELAELCNPNPREPGADARMNFCDGFAQGALEVQLHYSGDQKHFCFPKPMPTRRSTMREFSAWVRADSSRGSMAAPPALFRFLAERFPCKP
ncbi:MAG TPA: Rap1a/Tai family immunity protein [Rhodopila sp.]|nr:Rap1a/Tai family immunity protein [Rhodopila sp.]